MSLFPAYENGILSNNSSTTPGLEIPCNEPTSWLSNSSFRPDFIPTLETLPKVTIDSSDEEVNEVEPDNNTYPLISLDTDNKQVQTSLKKSKKLAKRSKSHRKHRKNEPDYELYVKNIYYDDKIRDRGNLKVDTLCSRARPLYNVSQKSLGFVRYEWKQAEPFKRYYSKSTAPKSKSEKHETVIKRSKSEVKESEDFNDEKIMAEQNATQLKIKEFNQKLAEEPTNVELWLQYANFENNNEFENNHNSSDIERIKYQRKLAIIEKALEANSNSKELLIAKLKFMSELVPADQYSQQIETLINKDTGNIVLWQALITATRSSIALCNVPRIQSLYSKCFGTLHLWSKTTQQSYDDRLLNILFQALIFLRHAGFWEQMSESIRLNLNLNLNLNSEDMNYWKESIDEKKLIDMEEVILTSELPLNQLWLRVEILRENCHWLSVSRDKIEFIGDSHRFISSEDIAEYVHPLSTRNSNFKMAIYILVALKVPILPLRHTTLKYLGMDNMNWTVDSIESLLSILFPCVGEIAGHENRLLLSKGLLESGLTSGPQYLRFHPAQEPYLDFIRNTFHTISKSLKLQDRISINVWWLRFERVLIASQKEQSIHSDKGFKKLRTIIKEFLKKDENRNNLHYYREYALIEYEIGRFQNSLNILKMAIQTKGNITAIVHDDNDDRTALMSLYRTFLQLLLDVRTRNEFNRRGDLLKVFSQMSVGQSESECLTATEKYLHNCYIEFMKNSHSLPIEDSMKKCFLPNFYCDAVACYVYLLYIIERPIIEIIEIFDRCLDKTRETSYLQEQFYENKIIFLQLINEKNNNLLNSVNEAMKNYPDNGYVLSVLAGLESESPYWSVSVHSKNNRLWTTLAICLAGRARLHSSICLNNPATTTAAINKLLHLYGKLSMVPDVRCCPLIWRLYMLLLRERNLCEKKGEEVYHASIAQCSWARCIYVDAAEIAPQFLTQIQDVIREKDLRMHVTVEELDILRG